MPLPPDGEAEGQADAGLPVGDDAADGLATDLWFELMDRWIGQPEVPLSGPPPAEPEPPPPASPDDIWGL